MKNAGQMDKNTTTPLLSPYIYTYTPLMTLVDLLRLMPCNFSKDRFL